MSENDSFIDEVSEELRKDKLFGLLKKYLWVFIALVIAIVGGAAYNEYSKAQKASAAQSTGEAFLTATESGTSAAFAGLADLDAPSSVLAKMEQAAALHSEGQTQSAAEVLQQLADDQNAPLVYQDMALLKIVMINGANMETDDLMAILDRITSLDAPFRLLALEQRAIVHVRNGNTAEALADLERVILDDDVTQTLRNRAQELTIALGGDIVSPLPEEIDTSDG